MPSAVSQPVVARLTRAAHFIVVKDLPKVGQNESARHHVNHLISRLAFLQRVGLADSAGPNTWHIRRDLEEVLRAMHRTSDRQRTLAAHGVPISDQRLPLQVLDMRQFATVEGRVLVQYKLTNGLRCPPPVCLFGDAGLFPLSSCSRMPPRQRRASDAGVSSRE